jgi:hypothetical protein
MRIRLVMVNARVHEITPRPSSIPHVNASDEGKRAKTLLLLEAEKRKDG